MQDPRDGDGAERPKSSADAPTPDDFADQFQGAFRVLWLIALSVVRDAALAEDIVQEAALVALEKYDHFRPGTNFSAWMGQIVRNLALNRARKERRRRTAPIDPATLDEQEGGPSTAAPSHQVRPGQGGAQPRRSPEQKEIDRRILTVLDEVGDTARACLLLRTMEGMSYARIAPLLGIPEGTAMSHVHRARRLLRERLGDLDPEDAS